MSISNSQVIIIESADEREAVVQFMLERGFSFQTGFIASYQAQEIADDLSWQESSEDEYWQSSGY